MTLLVNEKTKNQIPFNVTNYKLTIGLERKNRM